MDVISVSIASIITNWLSAAQLYLIILGILDQLYLDVAVDEATVQFITGKHLYQIVLKLKHKRMKKQMSEIIKRICSSRINMIKPFNLFKFDIWIINTTTKREIQERGEKLFSLELPSWLVSLSCQFTSFLFHHKIILNYTFLPGEKYLYFIFLTVNKNS